MIIIGLIFSPKKGEYKMGKAIIIPQKRTWIHALFGLPKELFEKGPRPLLVHPDVIKDREERAKKAKAEQTSTIQIQVTCKN